MPADDKQGAAVPCPSNQSALTFTQAVSYNRKGYGPLASSTLRLAQKLAYTGPGPGSYTPQKPAARHACSDAGSAAFCTTGRSFSAGGTSSGPAPGAHGVPVLAYNGTDLKWGSHHRPGAAAAFKAPARSEAASAAQLREQLQQRKYQDGGSVPWLVSPPTHTGGRPLPGPSRACRRQGVQSAHPCSSHRAVAGVTAGSLQQGGQALLPPPCLVPFNHAPRPLRGGNSSSRCGSVRTTWQPQDSSTAPGPGSYETQQYGSLQDRPLRSAFTRPLVQDRFGIPMVKRPVQQQQPSQPQARRDGHTQRACSPPPNSRQPGVSAGFRSKSPGHAEALMAATDANMCGAPGPSYYSPQPPPHKVSYRQARSAHTFIAAV